MLRLIGHSSFCIRMFGKILNIIKSGALGAARLSGPAALYLCAATALAAVLLGTYLKYAWNVDKTKLYKALAVLQGLETADVQDAARDKIAEISYETVLAKRASRQREEEFQNEITAQTAAYDPPPPEPKPIPPKVPSAAEQIDAYAKRVKSDLDKAKTAGLDEETRLLENMEPEQAKEVVRKLWKDGARERVLNMLLAMEEKRRGEILYAMQQQNAEELKDLCDILQKIGDGEPASSIIQNAAQNTGK
ncbi:MAG: hypothetical protein LBH00_00695 [Planctomycetaceae bacterium]|nr:hypothetical protein [Planctomycetaceae bacterium]